MSRGWRVLDFTGFDGSLGCRRGQIVASNKAGDHQVPFDGIAVVLVGLRVKLSSGLLHQLAANDIVLLSCDWKGTPVGGFHAWSEHTRVGARQRAQISATLPRCKNAWGRIIRAKVLGQAATLRTVDKQGANRLIKMARGVRSGDSGSVEAAASRWYWPRLFPDERFGRVPGASDNRNAQLNYAYTVLRGYGVRAVAAAGLSPALGMFHHGRSNAFNLVDDLIEPYRPAIDCAVAELAAEDELDDREVRRHLVAAATRPFDDAGYTIPSSLDELGQRLGIYLEGGTPRLVVDAWNGPPAEDAS